MAQLVTKQIILFKKHANNSNGEDTTLTLTSVSASGGSDKESVDSIKFIRISLRHKIDL